MADAARRETDRRLTLMEQHLTQIYSRASQEVGQDWEAYMSRAAERIKKYQDAYDAAKRSGDREAIKEAGKVLGQKQRDVTLMDEHYRAMTRQLAHELSSVNETAAAYINDQLPDIFVLNYNETAKGIQETVRGISFELVDANTVKNLATQDSTLLPYKYVDGRKDVRWNTQAVNAEVLQGIIQGESMPKIAKRLQNVTEMDKASAIRNARTATTGAENNGRMSMLRAARDKGVIANKVWIAARDKRTRDAHAELNGEEAEVEETFTNSIGEILYPGDPDADPANVYNCRCSLTYRVVGFGDSPVKETEQEEPFMFNTPAAEDITSANEYGTQTLGQIYDQHNTDNGLNRVEFSDANRLSQTVGADYSNLSVDTANVFNQQITRLANEYDTPLQRVRTMTKQEAVMSQNTFARVSHNYAVDSAEMVINPVKCKDVPALTERITELQERGYCVKIQPGREAEYIVTHEFGHGILDMGSPLSKNWVGANFSAVKSARSEIESIYTEYIAEVSRTESAFKKAEFDFIMGNGSSESALMLKKELENIKLSNYSLSNADEFLAEAFTNQKIGASTNPYAERAVSVLDKYFGR